MTQMKRITQPRPGKREVDVIDNFGEVWSAQSYGEHKDTDHKYFHDHTLGLKRRFNVWLGLEFEVEESEEYGHQKAEIRKLMVGHAAVIGIHEISNTI
ncbi:hypothetical protein GOBAR_AA01959 [Gossypium barbadense]|uniref:Uncharacterized protein n=1 Tax=Gossypium barbadense TaxID=3634 RepID=A0A2P5YSS2_GOSBA|nr:hypothetical protein GOBAR_AA01959 [Gossypium barbadense]